MFCQERVLVGEHEDEQTLHSHNPNTETLEPLGNIYLFILPFLGCLCTNGAFLASGEAVWQTLASGEQLSYLQTYALTAAPSTPEARRPSTSDLTPHWNCVLGVKGRTRWRHAGGCGKTGTGLYNSCRWRKRWTRSGLWGWRNIARWTFGRVLLFSQLLKLKDSLSLTLGV